MGQSSIDGRLHQDILLGFPDIPIAGRRNLCQTREISFQIVTDVLMLHIKFYNEKIYPKEKPENKYIDTEKLNPDESCQQ